VKSVRGDLRDVEPQRSSRAEQLRADGYGFSDVGKKVLRVEFGAVGSSEKVKGGGCAVLNEQGGRDASAETAGGAIAVDLGASGIHYAEKTLGVDYFAVQDDVFALFGGGRDSGRIRSGFWGDGVRHDFEHRAFVAEDELGAEVDWLIVQFGKAFGEAVLTDGGE